MADEQKKEEPKKSGRVLTKYPMPVPLAYQCVITNKDKTFLCDVLDDVQLTRGIDCEPSKLTLKIPKDNILDFTEGNHIEFKVNGELAFVGTVFEKSRDKSAIISVTAYDQLRYLKNKDCYVYGDITATDLIKNIAEDFELKVGEIDNTVYKFPAKPKRIEKDKTLADIIQRALDLTTIQTQKYYQLYDDGGQLMLKSVTEGMKTDIYIDDDCMTDVDYKTSIDKDTYDMIKVYRTVPDGESKVLKSTYVEMDKEHIEEWGRLQCVLVPDAKDVDAVKRAANMLKLKNRKTRDIRLKGVIGDIRVRGGSLLYVNKDFGDVNINQYIMVESVTHTFKTGVHLMDLDLFVTYEEERKTEVTKNEDAEAVKKIQAAQKKSEARHMGIGGMATGSGTAAQVDTAFSMNDGRVSPYGSVGCADTVCAAGSWYNKDLADEYNKGTASVPTLRGNLEAKGYVTESFNGYANKGDLLIYGDDDHVVIADGAGGCFGNSSSKGYAMHYGDAAYAWGNGELPSKVIRMGAT